MKFEVTVEPAHHHPSLLMDCCELINKEWPRSVGARMRSLQASSDRLPTSLLLLQNKKIVLGHAKLTPIPNMLTACFVESVVISKEFRGKGLGTRLMVEVEKYCADILNLKIMVLSTKGQEPFYSKLGYKECAPISLYGNGGFIIPNYIKKTDKTYMNKCVNF